MLLIAALSVVLAATVHVGGFPNAIAVGEGGVWAIGGDGGIVRIDPRTDRVVAAIPARVGSERACGVAAGAGSVWVAAPDSVLRIDPRSNRIAGRTRVPGATCVAVAGGAVWVTGAERGTVTRIDPRTGRAGPPIRAGAYPEGLAAGFGSLWVSSGPRPCGSPSRPCTAHMDMSGTLARIDPRTGRLLSLVRVPASPSYVATGHEGVWLSSNDGTIVSRAGRRIQVTGGRTSIAVGLGSVWVTSIQGPGAAGQVFPVDPRTGALGKPVTVGESPVGMAAGGGALWVANFNDGTVSKLVPALGRSELGRPIAAYELGDRSRPAVLVVGCTHGTECAGIAVADRLLASPGRAHLWIVPNLNPDGLAAGTRLNGRGVDLNRNFPAGWRPGGRPFDPEYPGPRPLSERETRIAQALILRVRPAVTIWFHQPQELVRAWGRSIPAARRFAALAGLPFRALPWLAGTAPNWQNHRLPGTSSFVVELPPGPLSDAAAERLARAVRAYAGRMATW